MHKRPIRYQDFDGNDVSEELYFNITKSELLAKEMTSNGTWTNKLMKGVATSDAKILFEYFEEFIMWTYGERVDSTHFVKNDEIRARFRSSAAYDALFMELTTNAAAAAEFIQAVMPKDLVDQVVADLAKNNQVMGVPLTPPPPPADPGFAAMQQAAAGTHILPGLKPNS